VRVREWRVRAVSVAAEGEAEGEGREESVSAAEKDGFRSMLKFAGPALGLYLANPLMSLVDTAVVGRFSSLHLAALGPGTVLLDHTAFVFTFMGVAVTNLVATNVAKGDRSAAAAAVSDALSMALAVGVVMAGLFLVFHSPLLQLLVGPAPGGGPAAAHPLLSPAASYVVCRAFAFPAVLMTMVSQAALIGERDAWGPLRCVAIGGVANLALDLICVPVLGYGIWGAAFATVVAQYLILALLLRGQRLRIGLGVPTLERAKAFASFVGPVFIVVLAKIAFYTVITTTTTRLGTLEAAANQVLSRLWVFLVLAGEPLGQFVQTSLPRALLAEERGEQDSARELVRKIVIAAGGVGAVIGLLAVAIPFLCPFVFTNDPAVVALIQSVWIVYGLSAVVSPIINVLDGTLIATKSAGVLAVLGVTNTVIATAAFAAYGNSLNATWLGVTVFVAVRIVQNGIRLKSGSLL